MAIIFIIIWVLIYVPIIIKPHKIEPFIWGMPYDLFWMLVLTLVLLIAVIVYARIWNPEGKK